MRPNPGTAELGHDLAARRIEGREPPTLFLCGGCARAAGTPRSWEVGRYVAGLADVDEFPVEPPDASADDAAFSAWFRKLLLTVPPIQRAGITLQAASEVPVPLFLQDLAHLIREGLFVTLMTTAFDALLGRSLASAGLHPNRDFRVLDVIEGADEPEAPPPGVIRVLKLHGERPSESGSMVTSALEGPIVVVGYESTDPPLHEALGISGGQVWWVTPEVREDDPLDAIRAAGRDLTVIDGEAGHPDRFLGELTMDFFRPDVANSAEITDISDWDLVGRGGVASALAHLGSTEPDPDDFERRFVSSRLYSARERLTAFEYQAAGGTLNKELDLQLAYQRRAVAELEERLRTLDGGGELILGLLSELHSALLEAGDSGAAAYVAAAQAQVGAELEKADPQQEIVSAVLAAATVLAERGGADPALVKRLADLTPSMERNVR